MIKQLRVVSHRKLSLGVSETR